MENKKQISDATCWGNTPACFYLEQKLNEIGDERLVRIVTKIILNSTVLFRTVRDIKHSKHLLMNLILINQIEIVKNHTVVPQHLKSTIRNIITAKYRQNLKGELSSNDKRKLRKKNSN